MSAEVAFILRDAADLLEREGWCPRLGGGVHEGPYCAVEAITEAVDRRGTFGLHSPALEALQRVAGVRIIGDWNDAQVSPEPVIAALRAAADDVERA